MVVPVQSFGVRDQAHRPGCTVRSKSAQRASRGKMPRGIGNLPAAKSHRVTASGPTCSGGGQLVRDIGAVASRGHDYICDTRICCKAAWTGDANVAVI